MILISQKAIRLFSNWFSPTSTLKVSCISFAAEAESWKLKAGKVTAVTSAEVSSDQRGECKEERRGQAQRYICRRGRGGKTLQMEGLEL